MIKKFLAIAILALLPIAGAQAIVYDFSYDWGGGQYVSGQLEGDLQGDGDTIYVSEVFADIFTPGGPYYADTTVDYVVDQNYPPHDSFGIVSLSGMLMDFVLHTGTHPGSCGNVDSICLITDLSYGSIGGTDLGYDLENWSISVANVDVPEPAALSLLGLGLMGMGFRRKFKRTA